VPAPSARRSARFNVRKARMLGVSRIAWIEFVRVLRQPGTAASIPEGQHAPFRPCMASQAEITMHKPNRRATLVNRSTYCHASGNRRTATCERTSTARALCQWRRVAFGTRDPRCSMSAFRCRQRSHSGTSRDQASRGCFLRIASHMQAPRGSQRDDQRAASGQTSHVGSGRSVAIMRERDDAHGAMCGSRDRAVKATTRHRWTEKQSGDQ